jgi:hypothetical protein
MPTRNPGARRRPGKRATPSSPPCQRSRSPSGRCSATLLTRCPNRSARFAPSITAPAIFRASRFLNSLPRGIKSAPDVAGERRDHARDPTRSLLARPLRPHPEPLGAGRSSPGPADSPQTSMFAPVRAGALRWSIADRTPLPDRARNARGHTAPPPRAPRGGGSSLCLGLAYQGSSLGPRSDGRGWGWGWGQPGGLPGSPLTEGGSS